MRERLISITIGGANNRDADPDAKKTVFSEYIQSAFPGVNIRNVEPISTAASLNSVCAYVEIAPDGDNYQSAFAKIHIESATESTSPLGVESEYAQANLLSRYGWPVLVPIMSSDSKDYPLLIYPRVDDETLFDLFKESYDVKNNIITSSDLANLSRLNSRVGKAMVDSAKIATSDEAVLSPVQTLFLERFRKGGRIDMWYKPDTKVALIGEGEYITWKDLLESKWVINGDPYNITLAEVIENARKYLSFDKESEVLECISHGDDHPGNIFVDRQKKSATLFDPAFAGWNPASLSNAKALAHTSFLPMGGMYYDPKIAISYKWNEAENVIEVDVPFESSVVYRQHEALARQIIDFRILPLIRKSKDLGISTESEFERIRYALAGCALLTINIPFLLEQKDGRGQGLLPLVVMFAELSGLPMLDYLREKITQEF